LSPHFSISKYFLFPLGLKKDEEISYQKRIFSYEIALLKPKVI
jgi:hypothetical protein